MQVSTSIMNDRGLIRDRMEGDALLPGLNMWEAGDSVDAASSEPAPESAEAELGNDESDAGLNDAARGEQEYVRQRLREELKREPTEEEMDEWLREHTEGY
jgi:hypothetical protein